MCELSIITCVYNEKKNIQPFIGEIIPVIEQMDIDYEIIFINDGSVDGSLELLEKLSKSKRIKIISLSRNFGKEIALTAGIDYSKGEAVLPIDVDLQEPIEMIPEFYAKWKLGYKSVIGVKIDRKYDSFIKARITSMFYLLIQNISKIHIIPNSSDFRLLDRQVVNEIIKIRETNRFMKGIYAFPGFSHTVIPYRVKPRLNHSSKWNLKSLWKLSLDAIFSFSSIGIKIWTYVGCLVIILTFIYSLFLLTNVLIEGIDVPGYITTIILIFLFGGTQFIALGILGEYISRIYEQVKNRPLYIIEKIIEN